MLEAGSAIAVDAGEGFGGPDEDAGVESTDRSAASGADADEDAPPMGLFGSS
jgi:hypothetical protein